MSHRSGTRSPAVAGTFYASDPVELRQEVRYTFLHPCGPGQLPENRVTETPLCGLIVPHAGIQYSGPVAAHAYLELSRHPKPDLIVILGPNHYGLGPPLALSPDSSWETPLGSVSIDQEAAEALCQVMPRIKADHLAHQFEHSIEVQLPFLQYLLGESFSLLPVTLADQDLETSGALGLALLAALGPRRPLIIASTDLSHYHPQALAVRKDHRALSAIADLSPENLANIASPEQVNMCGSGPVIALLMAARKLGTDRPHLLKYATSGDTSGNLESVVGYASLSIEGAISEHSVP